MSRIQRIELFYVEVPLEEPLYPAWYPGYTQHSQAMNLVRLTTDDGITGVSAGWALGPERMGLKSWLPGAFLGIDALDLSTARQRLRELAGWGWNNFWLEPAFWDIRGKAEGKPVYQLLADADRKIENLPVYCSTLESQPWKQRKASLEPILTSGFRAIKLRLSGDFDEDLAVVQGTRESVGEDVYLMLDACQGRRCWVGDTPPARWKLSHALDFAAAVEPYRIEWLEEPLDMHAYGDLSVLRAESAIPIAGGRMNAGWHEFKLLIEQGSLDYYQPDATIAGGLKTIVQVMDACARRDLYFSPNSGTNGISMLINMHVCAAWPRVFFFEFPFEPKRWTPAARDILLRQPIELSEGGVMIPQTPGLGIELSEDALEKYATCWLDVSA